MFDAGADHLFQVHVMQVVGLYCAHIFVREIDARHAFVVRSKGDRHTELPVQRKWMIFSNDAENQIVAAEADLDHDVLRGHFFQQFVRAIFVHDVNAVADAFRRRLFDCQANVAAQPFIGNEAGRDLSRMQADVNCWDRADAEI